MMTPSAATRALSGASGNDFRCNPVQGNPRLCASVLRIAGNSGDFEPFRLSGSAAVHYNPANLLGHMLGQGWTWHGKSID